MRQWFDGALDQLQNSRQAAKESQGSSTRQDTALVNNYLAESCLTVRGYITGACSETDDCPSTLPADDATTVPAPAVAAVTRAPASTSAADITGEGSSDASDGGGDGASTAAIVVIAVVSPSSHPRSEPRAPSLLEGCKCMLPHLTHLPQSPYCLAT